MRDREVERQDQAQEPSPAMQTGAGANARSLPDAGELRRRIDGADQALAAKFWAGADVEALVAERARFIDAFLAEIWQHWFLRNDNLALLAVGGYGRGELHPHSDVDLLILVRRPRAAQDDIAAFVRLLWDLRLDIGHSVRTIADCRREAQRDVTVVTTMMERRRLAGSVRLAAKLDRLMARRSLWPSRLFFRAKRSEQSERHRQFDNVDYDLEPNIKGAPGGLRDIQTVLWITARHLVVEGRRGFADGEVEGQDLPSALVRAGFLTAQECRWLLEGRRFLWRVRFGLHLLAGRKEDRLLFDHQRELARRFGYEDSDAQLGVEQFMRDYYRHVLALREVNDILLQHFEEAILRVGEPSIEPLNERFRINNNYMEAVRDDVFRRSPAALMEMFVLMAHRRDIAGVRAATIRLVRDHLDLIDEAFRNDPAVTDHFMALLRAPYTVVSQLTRMRRYGVLGRYIPEFGRVVGQMQFDLFHSYTVDAHTMMVIRNMRQFRYRSAEEKFPVAARVVRRLPSVELLYVAGLFHDIGKGRGGDHSTLGATDVVRFCRRHRLDEADTALVEWLVQHHLAMSATAQRKDIDDPTVIHDFARLVGSKTRLDYLYALTVADINATNPTLWNGWRASLLSKLYSETLRVLESGLDAARREARIAGCRAEALADLEDVWSTAEVGSLWRHAPREFFLHHTPAQVAAVTHAMLDHDLGAGPLAVVLDPGEADDTGLGGATGVCLLAQDRGNLFADSIAAMASAGLSVAQAHIATGASGRCFNNYAVLDRDGRPLALDAAEKEALAARLAQGVEAGARSGGGRRVPRQLRQFAQPSEVTLTTEPGARTSTLRVVAPDRPGLLLALCDLFLDLDLDIRSARINTLGERVEDVFEITNRSGRAITHAGHVQTVTRALRLKLDAKIAESA